MLQLLKSSHTYRIVLVLMHLGMYTVVTTQEARTISVVLAN